MALCLWRRLGPGLGLGRCLGLWLWLWLWLWLCLGLRPRQGLWAEHIAQDIWGCSAFMLSKWDSYCRVDLGSPSQNFFRAPRHGRLGSPWNIPTDIGCVLGPDLAAKTSEHLSEGFRKLPSVFPSVFCTMTYTVLGSQIPHLSKETHKKTSMTVHLRLKCEYSVPCLFISA